MLKSKKQIAVIGGGAAGLCAAIEAARTANGQAEITVFEALGRCGKKILATGNGRCNLANTDTDLSHYHGDVSAVEDVFAHYSLQSALDFFKELGLFMRADAAGRIYPLSNQASAVLDALRFELDRLQIQVKTEQKITDIKKHNGKWLLNGTFAADFVVLACGGKAAPVHGSDGTGYVLAKQLCVQVEQPLPALTALVVDQFTKALKGIRAEGSITVKCAGKVLAFSAGEIQYTDYGLSGIPAMQVSGAVSRYLSKNEKSPCQVIVDRAPSVSAEELTAFIERAKKERPNLLCEDLLTGIMPKRLGVTVLTECSLQPQKPLTAMNTGVIPTLVAAIKNKKYKINSVCGFADAQVTAGGIPACEINTQTMELRKADGVFVCGELVNVDGDCGGYNLLWAWNSGRMAGANAAKRCLC
ncbi:MAG: aminoacetone oxidase family FAD-binding enzyme [Clostridia bacterium]|nr:aminoacetone oxidase family FAD-binding enzyme [Clostridia bacterium]